MMTAGEIVRAAIIMAAFAIGTGVLGRRWLLQNRKPPEPPTKHCQNNSAERVEAQRTLARVKALVPDLDLTMMKQVHP